MTEKLTIEQWVDAGLKALARQGFTALKADLLAKALSVSRGSFYWHFADLEAFHEAVIERWHVRATDWVMAEIDKIDPPAQRLPTLLRRAFGSDTSLEMAVRAWAFSSPRVANTVEEIDELRQGYMEKLLADEGRSAPAAKARMLYWAYLGFVLSGGSAEQAVPVLAELI